MNVKQYRMSEEWYGSYIDTYLTKDVSALINIGDKRDFMRLVRLLAANTSQVLNMSHFAADIGADVKTIKRWISVLEASYVIFLLEPYHKNFGKRIVKSPKTYFYDTGLVSYLTGIRTTELFEQGPMMGAIFENHIVAEVVKRGRHTKSDAAFYYLRTNHGEEVDLLCQWNLYRLFRVK